jgi:glycosyltransferase involved in cell wall biosynthesis
MKILIFLSNFNYLAKNPYVGCGWVESLLTKLQQNSDYEFATVFFSDKVNTLTSHEDEKNRQYVIPSYITVLEKIKRNLCFKDLLFTEREDLVLSVINKFNPDIIHVFGTENPFGLLSIKLKIPVLIHIQGILNPCLIKWFPSGYSVWDVVKSTSLKRLLMFSGYWGDYIRFTKNAKREITIFKNVNYFCGRTDWDRQIVGLLSNSSNYFHCEEMLRPSFYSKRWDKKRNRIIQILSVVNPNIYKGIETILEAAQLLKLHTVHNFTWMVAGVKSDNALVHMFLKKTKILPEAANVLFLGPLQVEAIVDTMMNSDLFVHPSHIDNSPNSVCEAMILGMPIISTNVGGIKSILTDQVEGLLVQDGEPFGLSAAINELIHNPSKCKSYGDAARIRALQRHEPNQITRNQLEIYKSIVKINEK